MTQRYSERNSSTGSVACRSLDKLIDIHTIMPGVIAEATEFIAMHFYDRRKVREEVCPRTMSNAKVTTEPELKTLPPTNQGL